MTRMGRIARIIRAIHLTRAILSQNYQIKFLSMIHQNLANLLNRLFLVKPKLVRESIDYYIDSHAKRLFTLFRGIIMDIGITDDVVEIADKSVNRIIDLAEKSTGISHLLYKIRNKKDYIYDHSYLASFVCCHMLKQMHWTTNNKIDYLCMASLFHDILLDDPNLAMVENQNDPN